MNLRVGLTIKRHGLPPPFSQFTSATSVVTLRFSLISRHTSAKSRTSITAGSYCSDAPSPTLPPPRQALGNLLSLACVWNLRQFRGSCSNSRYSEVATRPHLRPGSGDPRALGHAGSLGVVFRGRYFS